MIYCNCKEKEVHKMVVDGIIGIIIASVVFGAYRSFAKKSERDYRDMKNEGKCTMDDYRYFTNKLAR
jgi:hypothetical protein